MYELSTDAATELIKAVIKHVRTSFFHGNKIYDVNLEPS